MLRPGRDAITAARRPWYEALHLPGSGQAQHAKALLLSLCSLENSDKDPFDDQIIAVWERLSSARIAALARAGG